MNSLNLLSARVTGQITTSRSPSDQPHPRSDGTLSHTPPGAERSQDDSLGDKHSICGDSEQGWEKVSSRPSEDLDQDAGGRHTSDGPSTVGGTKTESRPLRAFGQLRLAAKRLAIALAASLKWIFSTLALPGTYVIAGFRNEKGTLSPFSPIRKLRGDLPRRSGAHSTAQALGLSGSSDSRIGMINNGDVGKPDAARMRRGKTKRADDELAVSGSETDSRDGIMVFDVPRDHQRHLATSSSSSEEMPETRRSPRIKVNIDDGARKRKPRRMNPGPGTTKQSSTTEPQPALTVSTIKSPTSPILSRKTITPIRTTAPPRPLIPSRQPSYSTQGHGRPRLAQKTLVIDLDETLIHSLAKGGRMSSGHMVEVKLNVTVGYGGATLGPQHPILYYVHKRPHCDDFLRKVCRWYNLVVFTASVQEYADPVIDWLEQERKYFSGRYYRQHCTFRNGAYIKDLSSIEPDLSKVMILDNSPLSYIFHEGRCCSLCRLSRF